MLGNLIAVAYLLVYLAAGYSLARLLLYEEPFPVRLLFSGAFALLLCMWLPALFSFWLSFGLLSQLMAAAVAAAAGAVCFFLQRRPKPIRKESFPWPMLSVLLPLFLLGAYLFCTHTIAQAADGSLHVGQSTYGDLAMHLGFITSIAEQGTFPPAYSIYYGQAVGYPFLCDSISSTFYVLGASLRFCALLPALLAYGVVLLGVWCFFQRWLEQPGTTVLATLLFFVGGGLGFAYHFDLLQTDPANLSRIFTGFYETPTNQPDLGLLWVNPIADMLVPQRATLFGWSVLFPCLYLLQRAAVDTEKPAGRDFILLGAMAGLLPLVHTHSFLALGMLSAGYLLRSLIKGERKRWGYYALYAGIALLLAAPQLLGFTFRQSESFLTLHFNWANQTDCFLWFYIKNLGLMFLLLPLAFLMADKRDRALYLPALVIWFFAETVQFQPNPYDNNKLLFLWFAFGCALIARCLTGLYGRLKDLPGRRYLAGLALICLFLSGSLTLTREALSDYELIDAQGVEAAEFIQENTPADSLFLTASNHNNAVAALTGRNILLGTDAYLYYHGFDTTARQQEVALLFTQPETCFEALCQKYGIDYVYISDYERYNYAVNEAYFMEHCPLVFENSRVRIYQAQAS